MLHEPFDRRTLLSGLQLALAALLLLVAAASRPRSAPKPRSS